MCKRFAYRLICTPAHASLLLFFFLFFLVNLCSLLCVKLVPGVILVLCSHRSSEHALLAVPAYPELQIPT